jgi:hypothetical protein
MSHPQFLRVTLHFVSIVCMKVIPTHAHGDLLNLSIELIH